MSTTVANTYPVGVYVPSAADTGNSYVQAAVTYLPAPNTFIGNLVTIPSTANTASRVYISADLESDYPWSQYNKAGHSIAYFISTPLSG